MQSLPLQKPLEFPENLETVGQLIRPDSRHWNVDFITKVFDRVSANAILNTPINRFVPTRCETMV